MFVSVCRLVLFRFSAFTTLIPSRFMSRFFLYLGQSSRGLSCLITPASVLAAQVTFAWDDTCDPNLAGYIVYYGYASGHYEGAVDVDMQITSTFLDLAEAQAYYFAVASYDANGEESELPSEIIFDGPRRGYSGKG